MINNSITDSFIDNEIVNLFQSNINITTGFQKNHIETGLIGFDFALATHVYNNYTFEIRLTNDGGTYLGYYWLATVPPAVVILSALPNG